MIPENEMNLTDRDVARIIAKRVYKNNTTKDDYALQLFIESLVLPDGVGSYNADELTEYIMDLMGNCDD